MQHDFILLDRSGSMETLWSEALNSVNAYVKKLADDKIDTGVTLATFDKDGEKFTFEVIRDRIIPSTWNPISTLDASPRGMTPLNDAIGRIVALARKGINGTQYDKLALIVMTDGIENASREFTHATAKALLDECRAKSWQVIFLGADFDNAAQASSYGNVAAATLAASATNLKEAMTETASLRAIHAVTGAPMRYTDEIKSRLRR
jgi:Mg-chelatase subunit ChlD